MRRQHTGWTSFLTDTCLQLQFAWAVRPLRAERTNPLHTQMWRAMPMRPQMDDPSQPQACPIQTTDWRGSGAHRWEFALRTRSKLCNDECGFGPR